MPEISVIVPFFNVGSFIDQCLDSITGQTIADLEIICVDDCGTDASLEIAEQHARRDERIRILRHDMNLGLGEARNTGLLHACGRYVTFVDSDDWLEADALEIMHTAMVKREVECVWSGYTAFDNATGSFVSREGYKEGYAEPRCLSASMVCAWAKMYSLDLLRRNAFRFPRGLYEDVEFYFMVHCMVSRIYILEKPLYVHRLRAGSIMAETALGNGAPRDILNACLRCHEYLDRLGLTRTHSRMFLSLFQDAFRQFINISSYKAFMLPAARDTLRSIRFPEEFPEGEYPYLEALAAFDGKFLPEWWYPIALVLNRCNPLGGLRRRWRNWLNIRQGTNRLHDGDPTK